VSPKKKPASKLEIRKTDHSSSSRHSGEKLESRFQPAGVHIMEFQGEAGCQLSLA